MMPVDDSAISSCAKVMVSTVRQVPAQFLRMHPDNLESLFDEAAYLQAYLKSP